MNEEQLNEPIVQGLLAKAGSSAQALFLNFIWQETRGNKAETEKDAIWQAI